MRFRELKVKPVPGTAHPSGARVYASAEGRIAVLSIPSPAIERSHKAIAERFGAEGFKGTFLFLTPGHEFTLVEVDDGAPAHWQEDGRPSYQDLERRVRELESALQPKGAPAAACGPGFMVRP